MYPRIIKKEYRSVPPPAHKVSTLQVASRKRQEKSIPRADTREMQKSKASKQASKHANRESSS
jgi:hypothetical protein